MKYNENQFKSIFKKNIADYLNEKVLLKERTVSLFFQLRTFDNMCYMENVSENILTKDIIIKWLEKRENESSNNQSKRASIIRCFCKYMYRCNTQNYVLPTLIYPVKERYIPHIYTNDEIKRFFEIIDNLTIKQKTDNKPVIIPLIYRILLFTGMRINEVLSLKIKDVNFKELILVIKKAKNNKDRIVTINKSLSDKLYEYHIKYNSCNNNEDYFFRNSKNNKITTDSFYEYFREYLWKAGIHHNGKGPRVHDFRHTFTVNCIHNWLVNGKDVKKLLPYLQTYLGHCNIEATYYYYRLTLSIYPYLEKKIINSNNDIIPTLESDDDYND